MNPLRCLAGACLAALHLACGTIVDDARGGGSSGAAGGGGGSGGPGAPAAPETLAAARSPRGLAIDATHVFWTSYEDGGVSRVPKSGGESSVVAASPGASYRVAVNGSHVFWTSGGGDAPSDVLRAPKGGGAVDTIVTGARDAEDVAARDDAVYWVDLGPNESSFGQGSVHAARPDGSAPEEISAPEHGPYRLSADASGVFWIDHYSLGPDAPGVLGWSAPTGARVLAAGSLGQGIAADTDAVYWVSGFTDGALARVPKVGGAAVVLAGAQEYPSSVAVDDVYVYWSIAGDPSVEAIATTPRLLRMAKGGGAVEIVVEETEAIWGLAADATGIYYATASRVCAIRK